MELRMKNFNILGVHWKIGLLGCGEGGGGGVTKTNIKGGLPKKGAVFLKGGLIPRCTLCKCFSVDQSILNRTLSEFKQPSLRKTMKKELLEAIFSYYNFSYWCSPIQLLKTTTTALKTLSLLKFTEMRLILLETVAKKSSVKKQFQNFAKATE